MYHIFIAGIMAVKLTKVVMTKETKDYSVWDTAIGKVGHTEDFYGDRWIVSFIDKTGSEVIGMDDKIAYSSFSHKYKRPVFGSEEQIYY